MPRIVYLDGDFLPAADAKVSIFDRGFLMSDGVYEVTAVLQGRLLDFTGHLERLARSLGELGITNPLSGQQWLAVHRELVARNQIVSGLVYLQVTRGSTGDRDFTYPDDIRPTTVLFTQHKPTLLANPLAERGQRIITLPDQRWLRRDIKTVQLLFSAQAKMSAARQGVDDVWMVEDGTVTEGSSNNAHIVSGGTIVTRPLSQQILAGITRRTMLRVAQSQGLAVTERPFTVAEAQTADEAFSTSASGFVLPVVEIDGVPIGDGRPGPVTTELRKVYVEEALRTAQ